MNSMRKVIIVGVVSLLLLGAPAVFSQSGAPNGDVLLEIIFTGCDSDCDRLITRVFANGRYINETYIREKTKSGHVRVVTTKTEKVLGRDELTELLALTEQSGFLNAAPEYVVKIVQDSPAHVTITYRNKGREKKVTVDNYNAGSESEKAKVPRSVLSVIRWAEPYLFP